VEEQARCGGSCAEAARGRRRPGQQVSRERGTAVATEALYSQGTAAIENKRCKYGDEEGEREACHSTVRRALLREGNEAKSASVQPR